MWWSTSAVPLEIFSIDMGLNVGNEVSLMHVADDTGDVLHRPNVPTTDVLREVSVASELRQRIVIQIHGTLHSEIAHSWNCKRRQTMPSNTSY